MKTKLTLLFTLSALAVASLVVMNAAPAQAAGLTLPAPVDHSTRFCGSHRHHHEHYWYCEGRDFWCPGHCD